MVDRSVVYMTYILTLVQVSGGILPKSDNNCGVGWTALDDTCYFHNFLRLGSPDEYELSYAEATEYCEKRYSTLARWKSQKQWKSVSLWLSLYTQYAILIDLRMDLGTKAWKWGNGNNLDQSRPPYWNEAPQSALSKFVPDLALTTQGTFTLLSGHKLGGFACTAQKKNGNCPKNFVMVPTNDTTCFYLSDLGSTDQMVMFIPLPDPCKKLGGKLATINTENDALSFAAAIPKNLNSENVWKFNQNTLNMKKLPKPLKWAKEPDNLGGVENCAVLYVGSGKISDVPCESRYPFVCQKPNVIPRLQPLTGKYACGNKGWIRGGDSCYFTSETKFVNWTSAQLQCQKLGSSLIKIESDLERQWLSTSFWNMYSWTGLCYDTKTKLWKWEDGTTANSTSIPWEKEPKTLSFKHGACAAASANGQVSTFSCTSWQNYVCEQRERDATQCPKNWLYFNTSCYHLNNEKKTTWRDATLECQKDAGNTKGYLYIPYGPEEWKFVVDNLLAKQRDPKQMKFFWIGLTDDNSGVWGFEWTNTGGVFQPTNVSHISWRKTPYYHNRITKDGLSGVCAVLTEDGKYQDLPTDFMNNMICETSLFSSGPATDAFTSATNIKPNAYALIALASAYIIVRKSI